MEPTAEQTTNGPPPEGIGVVGFMIDERAVVFVRDHDANRHFLSGIDAKFWNYQAIVHGDMLESPDALERQRAAAALRIAYGQGLETLFALIVATIQVPLYPLGWMTAYRNNELRNVVEKIHQGRGVLSPLKRTATWASVAEAIFEYMPEPTKAEVIKAFARLWHRLAEEFIDEGFEPEYNSLKHGMRSLVSGFSVAIGQETVYGQAVPREKMQMVGSTEYGSSFHMPPRKVPGFKRTYELPRHVSRAWVPKQFASALVLIGMSVQNVVGRASIAAGADPTTIQFAWPSKPEIYDLPFREHTSITQLGLGFSTNLGDFVEPSAAELRQVYEK